MGWQSLLHGKMNLNLSTGPTPSSFVTKTVIVLVFDMLAFIFFYIFITFPERYCRHVLSKCIQVTLEGRREACVLVTLLE